MMRCETCGMVYLVGAGPGDPGLITVRGLECLRRADVVVYDRLVSPELLDQARPDALRIYAGKEAGAHAMPQEEINRLLAHHAAQGRTVCRLKAGDPFVFGRGAEEAEFLRERGIPYHVVPGITSAVAVPAYAGIPVTHRDLSSSFVVVTGHEDPRKQESAVDWDAVARIGTVVLLMGMKGLERICERLVEAGRPPSTPAAVVQWGTGPEQRVVIGTLADIAQAVRAAHLGSPAVVVIGDVARLHERLDWFRPVLDSTLLAAGSES